MRRNIITRILKDSGDDSNFIMETIGIPKALLYHKFGDQWKSFFDELGFLVVFSDDTNRDILKNGVKNSVDEVCLPLKVYYGHILNLINKVDYIFIPRYVSTEAKTKTCPKMITLPDMLKGSIDGLPRVISPSLDVQNNLDRKEIFSLAQELTRNPDTALRATERFFFVKKRKAKRMKIFKNKLNIGLLAHSYILNDHYLNMDIKKLLNEMNVNVIDMGNISEKTLEKENHKLKKQLYWSFEKEILASAYYFTDNNQIDGIIHLTAFACGPDSVVTKIIEDYSQKKNRPYLKLVFDEHEGRAGINTRIEAFMDILSNIKVQNVNFLSAHR